MRINRLLSCFSMVCAFVAAFPSFAQNYGDQQGGTPAGRPGRTPASIPATSVNAGYQTPGKGIDLVPINRDLTTIAEVNVSQDTVIINDQVRLDNLNTLRAMVAGLVSDRDAALASLSASLAQTTAVRDELMRTNADTKQMNEELASLVSSTNTNNANAAYYLAARNCLSWAGTACGQWCPKPVTPAQPPG